MGVIINLKEIFAADGQEIFTDKINFNFNKLLELGIGEQGIQGIQGPVGAAGPAGTQGDEGQRGNKWFVGVGDPNTQVFVDLLVGDFYLETNDSSIWQYQGSPSSWIQVTDLSEVVVNIIEAEGSPFVRGFGEASPLDDRFITFTKRGNDNADIIADTTLGNNANNDTLLLTNWNERVTTIDNFPALTDDEFNAIQSISVNHTLNPLGRYHLEFSSLNDVAGQIELSDLNHNLKVRYLKEQVVSASYPVSNQFINIGRFSMSIPETVAPIAIDEQGIFEFITPKYQDITDGSPVKENMTLRIGSSEPLSETSLMDIAVDGIDLSVDSKAINFGLIRELETFTSVQTLPFGLSGEFGMINTSNLVTGLMIKSDTYHADSLSTIHIDSKYKANENITTLTADALAQGYQGIFSDGKYLMVASPQTSAQESINDSGTVQVYDISDPDNPKVFAQDSNTSNWFVPFLPTIDYDIHGNPFGDGSAPGYISSLGYFSTRGPGLTGVRDIAFAGKYGALVRRRPATPGGFPGVGEVRYYDSFIMFELDSEAQQLKAVSALGTSRTFADFMSGSAYAGVGTIPELDKARRVKISGNWAFVMTDSESPFSDSHLIAIDITNPARPYIDDTYITETRDTRHVDFDIEGEVAYILSSGFTTIPAPTYYTSIEKISIFDPTLLSTTTYTDTTFIKSRPLAIYSQKGSIKVEGSRIYITHEDSFYIYDTGSNVTDSPGLISTTTLPSNHEGYDVEISGKFAYVYAEDITVSRSTILTYDISDETAPLLLEPLETFASATGNGKPSRMTIVGDRIFTVAASNGVDDAGVNSVKINGINSPAAKIGNIHSKDVKVSNSVSVGETLQVGRSATIGSGGLWVDTGEGINTSKLKINLNNNDPNSNFESGLTVSSRGWVTPTSSSASVVAGLQIGFTDMDMQSTSFSALVGSTIGISDSVANNLTLNNLSIANTDVDSGNAKGINLLVSNLSTTAPTSDVYGIDISFSGITTSNPVIGLSIDGEDINTLSGDLEVGGIIDTQSNIDLSGSTSKINNSGDSLTSVVVDTRENISSIGIETNVVSSGRLQVTGNNGNGWNSLFVQWIRIGTVVHCHFRGQLDGLDINGNTIPVPHTGCSIASAELGFGHIDNSGTPSAPASASSFQFYVDISDNGTVSGNPAVRCYYKSNGAEVGLNVTNENFSVLRGSFSYIISTPVP